MLSGLSSGGETAFHYTANVTPPKDYDSWATLIGKLAEHWVERTPDGWEDYNEGLLLYLLGSASPTHPLPPESYHAFTASYNWRQLYGKEFLYAGPLGSVSAASAIGLRVSTTAITSRILGAPSSFRPTCDREQTWL